MDNFIKVLQIIYYIIFIPLGVFLIAGIIYLVVANPLGKLMGVFSGPSGGFGGPGGGSFNQEGGPSEMMKQMERGTN